MGKVLKFSEIEKDFAYERTMVHQFAISDETVGAKGISMTRGVIPPGKTTNLHYHIESELALYIVSGRCRCIFGVPGVDSHEEMAEAGDMVYVERGEVHSQQNLSDTEPVVQIACYSVPHGRLTGKVSLEKRD